MNLHQLRIFYTVAQKRTITAAAAELLLSQPAVSLQLQSLERQLGLPLFERGGPQLKLTDAGRVAEFLKSGQSLVRQVLDLDVLTVAAINGVALGGGLELALACDIRWAHSRAVLGLPESTLGLLPGWGGIPLLWRAGPASLAAEMVAGGRRIGARRARSAGLVSRLFDGPDFEGTVMREAARLVGPGAAPRAIKSMLKHARGPVELSATDTTFASLWGRRA